MEPVEIVSKQLERQNEILQRMLDIMPQPENRFMRILGLIVLFASAFSFVSIADVIIKWIIGG